MSSHPLIDKIKKKRAKNKKEKVELRQNRQNSRNERREERRENTKEAFKKIGQGIEDVVDTAWQGETDAEKKQREDYNEKVYQEQNAERAELRQQVFDWSLYLGLGGLCVVALYIFLRR
jgi:hypothetical protein